MNLQILFCIDSSEVSAVRNKGIWTGIFASVGMMVLILDGQTALEGAQTGIELCLKTVVPSLFPFFFLSLLLTGALSGESFPLLRPLGRLLGIPQGAESVLISGFLGGYPAGAQAVAALHEAGRLRTRDAQRMLAFCNNAGPAFLFGMVSSMFSHPAAAWFLWGIHILSAMAVALILPAQQSGSVQPISRKVLSLSGTLQTSLKITGTVCGWVILFRVIIAFLNRWILWLFPSAVQVALMGLLELSNGCCALGTIPEPELRFILCSGMLAFGGACVAMQTHSVIGSLSIKSYYWGKLLQTIFSLFLSCAIVFRLWFPCVAAALLFAILVLKKQKNSSIPATVGV